MCIAGQIGEQVTQQAVDDPGLRRLLAGAMLALELLECNLELVEPVVARFIDARRLARGTDEEPREEIRERRMVLPIRNEALQQIGTAEQRALRGRGSSER